jgi:hypothetical protein
MILPSDSDEISIIETESLNNPIVRRKLQGPWDLGKTSGKVVPG